MKAAITAVLRHPLAMAVKAMLRDLKWSLNPDVPGNPPIPAQVKSVVFVCLGNICRSPFARELAAHRLAETGHRAIALGSAGIRTTQAKRSPAEACAAAAAYGVQLNAHVPEQLTMQTMHDTDMVVVMDAGQFTQLRLSYPSHRDRIFLLATFDDAPNGAYARYNIADPFGQPLEAFEACYARIARALDQLLPLIRASGRNQIREGLEN